MNLPARGGVGSIRFRAQVFRHEDGWRAQTVWYRCRMRSRSSERDWPTQALAFEGFHFSADPRISSRRDLRNAAKTVELAVRLLPNRLPPVRVLNIGGGWHTLLPGERPLDLGPIGENLRVVAAGEQPCRRYRSSSNSGGTWSAKQESTYAVVDRRFHGRSLSRDRWWVAPSSSCVRKFWPSPTQELPHLYRESCRRRTPWHCLRSRPAIRHWTSWPTGWSGGCATRRSS
jgi:hypothetical protein